VVVNSSGSQSPCTKSTLAPPSGETPPSPLAQLTHAQPNQARRAARQDSSAPTKIEDVGPDLAAHHGGVPIRRVKTAERNAKGGPIRLRPRAGDIRRAKVDAHPSASSVRHHRTRRRRAIAVFDTGTPAAGHTSPAMVGKVHRVCSSPPVPTSVDRVGNYIRRRHPARMPENGSAVRCHLARRWALPLHRHAKPRSVRGYATPVMIGPSPRQPDRRSAWPSSTAKDHAATSGSHGNRRLHLSGCTIGRLDN